MRKSLYAIALCSTTLVLMAGRCSDDDDSKPQASSGADAMEEMPAAADVKAPAADDAATAAGDEGKAIDKPVDAPDVAPDANSKDPDDVFKDPLEGADGAMAPNDQPGAEAPAANDPALDDPSLEPEAPPAEGGTDL